VVDPYIDVQLKGIQIDETSNMPKRSNIVKNNGFNPIFNFTVDFQISCPDLAFIIVKVFDKDVLQDDRLGMNVVSVMSLRRGYRVLPLLDSKLNQIENCYLFLHLEIFDLGSK
jgi:Ca2+-dependent lipid-binding protein